MDNEAFPQQNDYEQDNSSNIQEINELQCSNNIPKNEIMNFNNKETNDNIFNNITPKAIISKKGLIKSKSTSNIDNNYIKKTIMYLLIIK